MATLTAFKPLRYSTPSLADVIAPPYDVVSPDARAALAARSPHNVVHVDLPQNNDYAKAAADLSRWVADGVLQRETEPAFFPYEQTFRSHEGGSVTRRGFFGLIRGEPYDKRVVLPHERTLSGPKEDRFRLFAATHTALSPVFLLYSDPTKSVGECLRDSTVIAEFETEDGISHRLGRVTDTRRISRVVGALQSRSMLIADGHHRYETALRYASEVDAERERLGLPAAPNGSHRFVLAYLVDADDPGLIVLPTHRLVHDIADFDHARLLSKARAHFDVHEVDAKHVDGIVRALADAGTEAPSLVLALPNGKAHVLSLRPGVDLGSHPLTGKRPRVMWTLDVVLLHDLLLEDALGITPEKQASQAHLTYLKSAEDAFGRLGRGEGQALFLMNATRVDHVRAAAEAGEVMPQKSTFFYPKVPTGLLVHGLDPEERAV